MLPADEDTADEVDAGGATTNTADGLAVTVGALVAKLTVEAAVGANTPEASMTVVIPAAALIFAAAIAVTKL